MRKTHVLAVLGGLSVLVVFAGPVAAAPRLGDPQCERYTVKSGDTAWGVARAKKVPWDRFVAINGHIEDLGKLWPLDELNVNCPAGAAAPAVKVTAAPVFVPAQIPTTTVAPPPTTVVPTTKPPVTTAAPVTTKAPAPTVAPTTKAPVVTTVPTTVAPTTKAPVTTIAPTTTAAPTTTVAPTTTKATTTTAAPTTTAPPPPTTVAKVEAPALAPPPAKKDEYEVEMECVETNGRRWDGSPSCVTAPETVAKFLYNAGFRGEGLVRMLAIVGGESGFDLWARGDLKITGNEWGPSVGWAQVRTRLEQTGSGGPRDIEALDGNPVAQAAAAYRISSGGENFQPWGAWTDGGYKKHLDRARSAVKNIGA